MKSLLALAATAAVSASAAASTWTMTFTGMGPYQVVGVNYGAGRSYGDGPVGSYSNLYTGRMMWNGPYGKTYSTFCTQLTEYINFNQTVDYTCTDIANVPDGPGSPGPMGAVRAELLRDLYARNYAAVVASNDGALNAAFQIAVWEITHENITALDAATAVGQLDAGLGALQMNGASSAVLTAANLFLSSLGGANDGFADFDGVFGLTHDSAQDQLVVVPVPAPAVLAGIGLLGLGLLRRRVK